MSTRKVRKSLTEAREELTQMIQERERIETKIAQLRRMIAGMASYVERRPSKRLPGLGEVTLKSAIRTALRALGKPAKIADIRAVLKELNYTIIEEHKNPAATVVNVLQRLITDGEVEYGHLRDGKKTYVWILPVYGAATSLANQMEDQLRDSTKRK